MTKFKKMSTKKSSFCDIFSKKVKIVFSNAASEAIFKRLSRKNKGGTKRHESLSVAKEETRRKKLESGGKDETS